VAVEFNDTEVCMKKVLPVFLVAVFAVLLSGCQPTPDKDIVAQKDLEQMIEKGMEGSGETTAATVDVTDYAALCEYYGVPEHFQKTISKGELTINCDVAVELPQAAALPMARVEAGEFSQERVYKFWDALVGDTPMYLIPEQADKEYWQRQILESQAELAAETDEQKISLLKDWINDLKESYEQAPDHNVLVPADGTLQTKEMREFNIGESLGNYTALTATSAPFEDGAMTFYVSNDVENATGVYSGKDEHGNTYTLAPRSCAALQYRREGMDTDYSSYWQGQMLSDVTALSHSGGAAADCILATTPQQAREKAEGFLEDMGLDDMTIDTVTLCSSQKSEYMSAAEGGYSVVSGFASDKPARQAYVFRVLRRQGGVKVESTHETSQTTLEMAQGDGAVAVGKEWAYEYMIVAVDDAGIANVYWQGPIEVTEVLTENTAMQPWSAIQDVFERMIFIKHVAYMDTDMFTSVTIDITHVSLSLQRVMERDSYTTGLLVPAWNFYGTMTCAQADGDPLVLQCGYTPFISINAIDGSVVDVNQGY
jgi:hypothetical protein